MKQLELVQVISNHLNAKQTQNWMVMKSQKEAFIIYKCI
ncbi:unnamed protein product [Paramecium sonneborni]|uniref:Uncharacterized protein n=1 Tax=Paramecium sonneborni TaxID=65129 RepID=A0A8S1KBW8_9CILI|nr:unnamed protein product [Paramecium sonneborni]